MARSEITQYDALIRLGASTAEAVARVLEMFLPDGVERGEVSVLADGTTPFTHLPINAIIASVHYIDGVTGANIFVMTPPGARALATAMGAGAPEGEAIGDALSEFEMSAVGEAANQMLAAAAAAISVVLGEQVEISPPDTRVLDHPDDAIDQFGKSPHSCSTSFTVAGEPCRLIQLVPSAFVVRMVRALDEISLAESPDSNEAADAGTEHKRATDGPVSLTEALHDVGVRVWAELGRTHLPLGQALDLPIGAVVDLDRAADSPIDLFVNGLCFGHGQLLVTGDGEWAVQVQSLITPAPRKLALGASRSHHE
ncbi:MAG: FliM/FliN family flagellar motor switch protein [Solirubrobacteraceae bacterium]